MDKAFLKEFIDEDIYVLKEEISVVTQGDTPVRTPDKTEVVDVEASQQEDNDVQEPDEIYTPAILNYKGGNEKGIAILISNDTSDQIDPTEEMFLLKILAAVNLTINDVAIINIQHKVDLTLDTLIEESFNTCLSFGDNKQILSTELYTIDKSHDITLLSCHTLSAISLNVEHKKMLWTSLKTLFTV